MSESLPETEKHGSAQSNTRYAGKKPAVGLVLTEDNRDEIARALLRAQQHGFQVLMTYRNDSAPERFNFIEMDHVRFIEPSTTSDTDNLRQMLSTAARTLRFPGLIYHAEARTLIDFKATLNAFSDEEYCIEGVPQSATTNTRLAETLVAIPAYNEAQTIGNIVSRAQKHADEVLVIDDGSTDTTAVRAKEADATVIKHETNSGYGAALKTAFQEATLCGVEQLVVLDGDGQHDPEDIPRLVDALHGEGIDITIGNRFNGETTMPLYRRFGLEIVNLMTNLSQRRLDPESWVNDTQSGYRAYNQRAIHSLAENEEIGNGMNASTDIIYQAQQNDLAIEETGTTINYEVENGNSHSPISHGIHLVMNIVQTIERDRPITLLGIPGFLSTFIGFGFSYWTMLNYLDTGGFPIGLALASMFFVLAGIFACFTAIILHSLSTQLKT